MPRLNDITMENKQVPTGTFGFSAVKIDNLGASEYTLVTIVQDASVSVDLFKKEMEQCLSEIVRACIKSPRADNLLIRFLQFGSDLEEIHGFKLLGNCNPDDYKNSIRINGCTALYDASESAITATANYARDLVDNDFDANAIIFIITDGMDNKSTGTINSVKKALVNTLKTEALESLITLLIGVGTADSPGTAKTLKTFKNKAGLTEYIELKSANANSLSKLADFVSQSISSQSQALGTGGTAKTIQLVI